MNQRMAQRFAAAAGLAAVLFLGAAAPAQARDLGPTPGPGSGSRTSGLRDLRVDSLHRIMLDKNSLTG